MMLRSIVYASMSLLPFASLVAVNGRLFAQTAVQLASAMVTGPAL